MKLSKDNVTLEIMVYIKTVFKSLTEKQKNNAFTLHDLLNYKKFKKCTVILDVASFYLCTLVNNFIIPKK